MERNVPENVNGITNSGKISQFLIEINMQLSHDPVFKLLDSYAIERRL